MWRVKEIMSQALEVWEKPTVACLHFVYSCLKLDWGTQKIFLVLFCLINSSHHHCKSLIFLSIHWHKGISPPLLYRFLHVLQLLLMFFFFCLWTDFFTSVPRWIAYFKSLKLYRYSLHCIFASVNNKVPLKIKK